MNALAYIDRHAIDRMAERMAEARIDRAGQVRILTAAARVAAQCEPGESVAVRVASLTSIVGRAWSDRSNGDTIVAIIRDRRVRTVMLRRSTQPFTPDALNVERCTEAS